MDEERFVEGFSKLLFREYKVEAPSPGFMRCIEKSWSDECIEIAIKDRAVPDFETYAETIDVLIGAGIKPECKLLDLSDSY